MGQTEQQWRQNLIEQESIAFRALVKLARSIATSPEHGNGNTGYTKSKHVAERILKLESNIANIVGDCPE